MSLPVALDELGRHVDAFGPSPFLVTTGGGAGHVVSVAARFDGAVVVLEAGRTSVANIDRSPAVTLLWPGPGGDGGGYALLVDGTAAHDGAAVTVTPTRAVLHRLAGAPDDLPSCVPIEETAQP